MTISSETNRVSYAGNGSTTAFSFPYPFLADADLTVVERVTSSGVDTVKTLTTDYTVAGALSSGGGTVTFNSAPTSAVQITIYRDPEVIQSLDLVENDPLPAESLEQAFDRGVMIAQRLSDRLNRTLRQPDGDPSDMSAIPNSVDRADMLLGFDASGNPEAVAPPTILSATATTLSAGASATASYDTSSGLLTIGVPTGATGAQGDPGQDGADGIFSALASQVEAEAGTDNVKGMTPLRVAQAISALTPSTTVYNDFVHYQDQAANTTAGPTYTSGAWRTVAIDTEVEDTAGIGGAPSSNQFTLEAGSYEFTAFVVPGRLSPGRARARLYNATDASVVAQGVNINSADGASDHTATPCPIVGRFTIAAQKTFELQVFVSVNSSETRALSSGEVEVYADILFRRYAT